MATAIRIGVIYQPGDVMRSALKDRLLGARLAAEATTEHEPASSSAVELIERHLGADVPSLGDVVSELVHDAGCNAVLGFVSVPNALQLADRSEAEGVLYFTPNNGTIWSGRRGVFYLGVPHEVTASGSVRYLRDELGTERLYILYMPGEFAARSRDCTSTAAAAQGMTTLTSKIGESPEGDIRLLEALRSWRPGAVCVLGGGEHVRLAELVKRMNAVGVQPPVLLGRGLLCREFAQLCGQAADGYDFVDCYLRGDAANEEEKHLTQRLGAIDPELVPTASHGWGWDCLRLAVKAFQEAGPRFQDQVAFVEALKGYPGVTGVMSFAANDHNGHWKDDPTTIARLAGGRYTNVSTLGR